ncbi:MAG: hypothetical protein U0441_11010 [Polyangiaceae bacterium]
MRQSNLLFVAATLALSGCAASPPPPPANALRMGEPAVTTRWEQFCEQAQNVSQASWLASSRGNEGWELVSMYAGVLCFKRPVQIEAPSPAVAPAPVMLGSMSPPVAPRPAPAPVVVGVRAPAPPTGSNPVPSVIDPGF